jgi:hypothetical protein
MARNEATVPASIWDDDSDFLALGPRAKLTYFLLLSQPELDAGGFLPLREHRWAGMTRGADPGEVLAALAELDAAGWAYSDRAQQEVFVSGFFETDRVHKQAHRTGVAQVAIAQSRSPRLAALASAELADLITAYVAPAPRGVRALVLERDGYRCRGCGWAPGDPVPFKPGTTVRPLFLVLEIDHVVPRARDGGGDPANLQVLCSTCNRRKGATA